MRESSIERFYSIKDGRLSEVLLLVFPRLQTNKDAVIKEKLMQLAIDLDDIRYEFIKETYSIDSNRTYLKEKVEKNLGNSKKRVGIEKSIGEIISVVNELDDRFKSLLESKIKVLNQLGSEEALRLRMILSKCNYLKESNGIIKEFINNNSLDDNRVELEEIISKVEINMKESEMLLEQACIRIREMRGRMN